MKYDGLNVSSLCCDVTDEAQLKGAIDYTHRLHRRLDVLINNAGLQYIFPLEEYTTEKFELLLKVMLIDPFIAITHAFPIMKAQRYGRVINMASINWPH